jgi:hypothetical protein
LLGEVDPDDTEVCDLGSVLSRKYEGSRHRRDSLQECVVRIKMAVRISEGVNVSHGNSYKTPESARQNRAQKVFLLNLTVVNLDATFKQISTIPTKNLLDDRRLIWRSIEPEELSCVTAVYRTNFIVAEMHMFRQTFFKLTRGVAQSSE